MKRIVALILMLAMTACCMSTIAGAEVIYIIDDGESCHIVQSGNYTPSAIAEKAGIEVSADDRITLETARSIREDFLQQNAFVDEDAYSAYAKQFRLLDMVLQYDALCRDALAKNADMNGLFAIEAREKIGRAKMADAATFEADYDAIAAQMKAEIDAVIAGGEEV